MSSDRRSKPIGGGDRAMTHLAETELTLAADDVDALAGLALQRRTPEAFETLEHRVNRLAVLVRETEQSLLRPAARAAIRALESGRPLSPEDERVLRVLVVGDAEQYLALENNFDDWTVELRRLIGEVTRLAQSSDALALAGLRGLLRDAQRLVPAMRAYAEDKRRLELFQRAMSQLDDANRMLLIQLVREMLDSPTR